MTDVGLVSVLPVQVFIALGLVTAGFCLTLARPRLSTGLLLLHVLVLILMLDGVAALVEPEPRFTTAWLHAGITDYIMRHGQVDPTLDARYNWPAFFAFGALLTRLAGLPSVIPLMAWAPILYNVLYLGPLVMILRSSTKDARLVWLGVWVFYLTDWIGQDYYSPQGLAYFLYLVILGILLQWFKAPSKGGRLWRRVCRPGSRLAAVLDRVARQSAPVDGPDSALGPWQRATLMAIAILLFAAVVPTHQLTPFFLLGGVTALVVFKQCTARTLPLLMTVLIAVWISYAAAAFLAGHLNMVVGGIGHINQTVGTTVTQRAAGSPGHVLVVRLRMIATLALWGAALVGGILRLRKGYWDLTCVLLAAAPFPFVPLQSYGGEMLLRVYLFVLPFMAFFVAALFYTTTGGTRSWRTPVVIGLMSIVLGSGFFFTRYGNERMDNFTPAEVAAVHHLYTIAKPGSLLVAVAPSLPWMYQDWEKYSYASVTGEEIGSIAAIVQKMDQKKDTGSYLIVTRSEIAQLELDDGWSDDQVKRMETDLAHSQQLTRIFSNSDAQIYILSHDAKGAGHATLAVP